MIPMAAATTVREDAAVVLKKTKCLLLKSSMSLPKMMMTPTGALKMEEAAQLSTGAAVLTAPTAYVLSLSRKPKKKKQFHSSHLLEYANTAKVGCAALLVVSMFAVMGLNCNAAPLITAAQMELTVLAGNVSEVNNLCKHS